MLDGAAELLAKRRPAPMEDPGVIVGAVSWALLVAMLFTVVLRFALKFGKASRSKTFGWDDVFVGLAALFSIGQTAAVSMEARHAIGQHSASLSKQQLSIFQKAEYAGCMLYIANMGCARISICLLIKRVLPGPCSKYSATVFAVFSALWTVSGVLVAAFPCTAPNPWETAGKKCFNLVKFVNYVSITNIVVEVLLVSIPLFVWNLRLTPVRRLSVSACFLSRLSIVVAVAVQLSFFNRYASSQDFTFDYWRTMVCVQVAQNLSVVTACIPCLHPFILSILSGETIAESLRFDYCKEYKSRKLFGFQKAARAKRPKFDATSSQCSTTPIAVDDSYCKPLATYGLDGSPSTAPSQTSPRTGDRLPSNAATPAADANPPGDVFNRTVEYPRSTSRPATTYSNADPLIFPAVARSRSPNSVPATPQRLSDVGVLPIIEWETDGSEAGWSGRGSPERRRDTAYLFSREKVISVPEDDMAVFEQEHWRRYPPPPSGEK